MLNVLVVVAAIELLGLGRSGAGFLNSAYGLGGLLGAIATVTLLGSAPLARAFAFGLVLWGAPIALVGIWPEAAVGLLAVTIVGVGNAFMNVGGYTLLQRLVPDQVLARVFGVLETLVMVTVALGAIVTPLLIDAVGLRATLVGTGAILPVLALLNLRRLRRIDDITGIPDRELALLAGVDLFAPLPGPALERVARRLTPAHAPAGEAIVRQGDAGDRFYLVGSGVVEVSADRRTLERLGPGSYFGEIALLRAVPRTATVTAVTDCELFTLGRDDFVATLTAHARSGETAAAVVAARFART
jgi:MFS family permease